MPRSNTTCTQSGIYRNDCAHRSEIALSKGDNFPPCGTHGMVTWTLVRATNN